MVRHNMSIVMREQFLGWLIGAWSSLHDHVGLFLRLWKYLRKVCLWKYLQKVCLQRAEGLPPGYSTRIEIKFGSDLPNDIPEEASVARTRMNGGLSPIENKFRYSFRKCSQKTWRETLVSTRMSLRMRLVGVSTPWCVLSCQLSCENNSLVG